MCPECNSDNNTYDLTEHVYSCEDCGWTWDDPDYLLVPAPDPGQDIPPTQWRWTAGPPPVAPPPGPAPSNPYIIDESAYITTARLMQEQANMQRAVYAMMSNISDGVTLQPEIQPELLDATYGRTRRVGQDQNPPGQEGAHMIHGLTLPPGWTWLDPPAREAQHGYVQLSPQHVVYQGDAAGPQATYTERVGALVALAKENRLKLVVNRNSSVVLHDDGNWEVGVPVPEQFLVCEQRYFDYNYGGRDFIATHDRIRPCTHCGTRHVYGTLVCPTTGLPVYCAGCGRSGPGCAQYDAPNSAWHCLTCSFACNDCGEICPSGFDYCSSCRVLERCVHCSRSQWNEPGSGLDPFVDANGACTTCRERCCPECGTYSNHALQWSPSEDRFLCRNCWRDRVTDVHEIADTEDDDTAQIEAIPGRENIRMCGIELEGGNGTGNGETLARELYNEGLSPYNGLQGYHHGAGAFIHVETDSSVDWEVVIGPLNPADRDQMHTVNQAMRLIRRGIRGGQYKLDLRCGLHIHVGAEKYGLAQAYNLNTLFSFVEDAMFRIASAKWPIHRSMTGSPYCDPVQKSTSKLAFGREVGQAEERDARRVALNFRNYFHRMLNNCRCGAVRFDSWEDCTCDLGKCTFEFRLFNSTANPRKLHAYLALAQALVAKAGSLPEIEDPSQDFPPQTFIPKPIKGMEDDELAQVQGDWLSRLRWIFNELPLTADEKESVMYCVRNSDLASLGEDFLAELLPTTEEVTA